MKYIHAQNAASLSPYRTTCKPMIVALSFTSWDRPSLAVTKFAQNWILRHGGPSADFWLLPAIGVCSSPISRMDIDMTTQWEKRAQHEFQPYSKETLLNCRSAEANLETNTFEISHRGEGFRFGSVWETHSFPFPET